MLLLPCQLLIHLNGIGLLPRLAAMVALRRALFLARGACSDNVGGFVAFLRGVAAGFIGGAAIFDDIVCLECGEG